MVQNAAVLCGLIIAASPAFAADISGSGWRLWPDAKASWQVDALYLPSEVELAKLPVNPPTGGWGSLSAQQGIPVTLPSTVEEHYWGKFGTRPYTKHEAQRGAGTSFKNGNYLGVSWWWREVKIPAFKPGQRVLASFRGARLRSEVYCNGKLVGYSIMGELPFQADLTDAVRPGQNAQLAVRITNPGGHLDWIDFAQMQIQWGRYTLPPSHGFGGLDNDIQLDVRDNVAVTDVAAINKPDLHQVHLVAEVGSSGQPYAGPVRFEISRKGRTVWTGEVPVALEAGQTRTVELDATVPTAEPWSVQSPNLYAAKASLPGRAASAKGVNFGFRFMTAEGIGTDGAKLVFNGKRIVPISAISWGYWGRNGLWPDQEMAEREVSAAKKMGLNCLQFHRNIGRPAVLDLQDREGLLRCEEPGGGKFVLGARYSRGPFGPNGEFLAKDEGLLEGLAAKKDYIQPEIVDTSGAGPDGDAQVFWEKYMEEKILAMVKRDRSHPSLIMYTIQNENSDLDLRNPRIFRVLRRIQSLDPSRIVAFFSGGVPKDSQVLMLPYDKNIRYGSKDLPFAGWRDVHTCGGPSNYTDLLYQDPQHFKQRQNPDDRKSIAMWGEMLGAGAPDDYDKLVHSFGKQTENGYELEDAKQVLAGYHEFLDKWKFRQAFPTDSSLFQAIGYRTYYFWKRVVEQSRMDDANDYLVISGWESTTIDNHSGLVDNHRFFKGDPALLAQACQPEVLVVQPRRIILSRGEQETVDVFLINETNRTGPQTLKLAVRRPDGSLLFQTERPVNATGGDVYGQLLAEGIEFKADAAGMVKIEATLIPQGGGARALAGTDEIHVVDVNPAPVFRNIAVLEPGNEVSQTLRNTFGVTPLAFADTPAATRLDAVVLATKSASTNLFEPGAGASVEIPRELFEKALDRVKHEGTRLVLWPDNDNGADALARELARRDVVKYSGRVGNLNAPWFGSWFFTRKHWLLAGLPTDCAMDWRYGVSAFGGPEWLKESPKGTNTNGLLLDGPGVEACVGFGADHNTKVGISGCVIPYGKGQIVLYCLPQMVRALQADNFASNRVVTQRLLGNALR